jgi:hypothetical protein
MKSNLRIGILVTGALLLIVFSAIAANVQFNLSVLVAGSSPAAAQPWLKANITAHDPDDPTQGVDITLKAPGLSAKEKVALWYFNINAPGVLWLSRLSPAGNVRDPLIAGQIGNQFALRFWTTGSDAVTFGKGDVVKYNLILTQSTDQDSAWLPLTPEDFVFNSQLGGHHTLAHVVSIARRPDNGWITDLPQ